MFACAKARGKSPFLSKIIARANLSLSSFSRDYVLIKNYETFNFKFMIYHSIVQHNITVIDEGFTLLSYNTGYNAQSITSQFEASKTKRANLIFKANINTSHDNKGALYINGNLKTDPNHIENGTEPHNFLIDPADSKLYIYDVCIDGNDSWQQTSTIIKVTLYYK